MKRDMIIRRLRDDETGLLKDFFIRCNLIPEVIQSLKGRSEYCQNSLYTLTRHQPVRLTTRFSESD